MYSVFLNRKPVEGVSCRHNHHTESLPPAAENLQKTLIPRICGNLLWKRLMQTQTPPWVLACSSGEYGQDFDTNDVPWLLWSVCKVTELWCAKREEWPRLVLLILYTSGNDQGQGGLLRLCYIMFHSHCSSKPGQNYKDSLCPVCRQQWRAITPVSWTCLVSRNFPF